MQLFSADAMVFSKKQHEKLPSKVAHNRPPTFFSVLAWLPKRPKNRNPVPPKAPLCRTGYLDWDAYKTTMVTKSSNFDANLLQVTDFLPGLFFTQSWHTKRNFQAIILDALGPTSNGVKYFLIKCPCVFTRCFFNFWVIAS